MPLTLVSDLTPYDSLTEVSGTRGPDVGGGQGHPPHEYRMYL